MDDSQVLAIGKALADGKRFEMLRRIAKSKEAPTCSCIKEWTGLSPATVTHHLQELEAAGLIAAERCGKYVHVSLRRDIWDEYLKKLSEI
ncbi:hypothetical protein F183_A26530 [Bryobacterales bacterium F-183]|nr:hypothetical protein F183_A26530 [Bryobacterales bacterium F-183]